MSQNTLRSKSGNGFFLGSTPIGVQRISAQATAVLSDYTYIFGLMRTGQSDAATRCVSIFRQGRQTGAARGTRNFGTSSVVCSEPIDRECVKSTAILSIPIVMVTQRERERQCIYTRRGGGSGAREEQRGHSVCTWRWWKLRSTFKEKTRTDGAGGVRRDGMRLMGFSGDTGGKTILHSDVAGTALSTTRLADWLLLLLMLLNPLVDFRRVSLRFRARVRRTGFGLATRNQGQEGEGKRRQKGIVSYRNAE